MEPKLIIFAIDCFDLQVYEQNWRDGGYFPVDGVYTEMFEMVPTTLPVWTTFFTGASIEEHGILKTGVKDDGSPYSIHDVKVDEKRFIWNQLNEMNYSVGIYKLPMAYPVTPKKGWNVSDFFHPKKVAPPGIFDVIRIPSQMDYYLHRIEITDEEKEFGLSFDRLETMHDMVEGWAKRDYDYLFADASCINKIFELNPVDVLIVYAFSIDVFQHYAHPFPDVLAKVYDNVKMWIDSIQWKLKPDKIIAVSDHGCDYPRPLEQTGVSRVMRTTQQFSYTENNVLNFGHHSGHGFFFTDIVKELPEQIDMTWVYNFILMHMESEK